MAKIADVQEVSLEKLRPYERNAKKHGAGQIEKLKASIIEFGFLTPCLIDSEYNLIAGHGSVMAAKELGIETVPCVFIEGLTEEQRRAYILADNRLGELGEWDMDLVFEELSELDDLGFDVELTGFEMPEEIPEVAEDDFDESEVPDEPRAKLGDVWQLGNHRLICGDSTDANVVDKLINNETIDFVFTDPPYGINIDGDNSKRGKKTSLMEGGLKLKSFIDDSTEYAEKAFDLVQALDIKKQVWFGANYYCHHLPQTNNWLIWDKRCDDKMVNTNSDAELAWVLDGHQSCRIFRHLWNGLIKASENGEKRVHPTQKPIALVQFCINRYAPECETVLDLFGGSGSTLIACEQLGKKCFISEIDTHYCDVIIKRWETFTGREAVLIDG